LGQDRQVARAVRAGLEAGRNRKPQIVILATVLAAAGAWMVLTSWQPPAARIARRDDPPSPYLNTRPGVTYLGDSACTGCHAASAASFHRHPMSRSLAPVGAGPSTEVDERGGRVLFESAGLEYSIERRQGQVFHQETRRAASGRIITRNEVQVHYALGSGRQGISYLVEHDGFLFESALTWYAQKRRWDLSPGFEVFNYHFDRPIRPGCLFCHANRAQSVAGPINQYRSPIFLGHSIGCERCHGPGELHVASASITGSKDMTIVNPANLAPRLRDAVCAQCHLIGDQRILRAGRREEDYRPGLPLERFWTVFVQPPDEAQSRFVGQFEQMHASRCFRASQGRLGCISCHDPHNFPAPAEKATYYRGRCLECHAQRGCSLPTRTRVGRTGADDCASCHMPAEGSADIPHVATVDHRIPRDPPIASHLPENQQPPSRLDRRRLVSFHDELMHVDERPGQGRDLGVALCRDGPEAARVALPLLEAALAARPADITARESIAYALGSLGRDAEAMTAFQRSLSAEPARESALVGAAYLSVKMDRRQDAIAYWQRVIAVNPWRSDYHGELALAYFHERRWRASADACRAALRLNPSWVEVRKWLVRCLLAMGDSEAARSELETVLAFDPPDRLDLLRLFSLEAPSGSPVP
jgi:hypothetical protein